MCLHFLHRSCWLYSVIRLFQWSFCKGRVVHDSMQPCHGNSGKCLQASGCSHWCPANSWEVLKKRKLKLRKCQALQIQQIFSEFKEHLKWLDLKPLVEKPLRVECGAGIYMEDDDAMWSQLVWRIYKFYALIWEWKCRTLKGTSNFCRVAGSTSAESAMVLRDRSQARNQPQSSIPT